MSGAIAPSQKLVLLPAEFEGHAPGDADLLESRELVATLCMYVPCIRHGRRLTHSCCRLQQLASRMGPEEQSCSGLKGFSRKPRKVKEFETAVQQVPRCSIVKIPLLHVLPWTLSILHDHPAKPYT